MQWISITLPNVRPIVIVNVYHPLQGDYKKCCKVLSDAFDSADLKENSEIHLMGDFNINIGDKNSLEAKELGFTTRSLGLRQVIKEPTRVSFRDGVRKDSLLDLIFTNSDVIKEASTLDLNISNHLAVFASRKKVSAKKERVEFRGRSYRDYNRDVFQDRLREYDWENFFVSRDPDTLWGISENFILEELELMCPIKSFKVAVIREPWLTDEALEAIKDKDRLLKRAKKTRKEEDWAEAKMARNRVGRDLEMLRVDFLKQQQQVHCDDPKKFWATVASIIPNRAPK